MEPKLVKGETRVLLFVCLFTFGVLITGLKAGWNAMFDDFMGKGETHSSSMTAASTRGTLYAELEAVPEVLQVPGGIIRFGEAWLEERSLATHSLVWLPMNRRVGGYNLCFTLAEGDTLIANSDLFFVNGDARAGLFSRWGKDCPTLFVERLKEEDLNEVQLSLVSSWNDARQKNVRFVRKVTKK